MFKILFPGELLVDRFTSNNQIMNKTGGAPANAAVAVTKLHLKAYLLAALGDDERRETLINDVAQYGVNLDGIQVVRKAHNTVASVTIDAHGERSFEFTRGADGALDFALIPHHILNNYVGLHLGSATAMLGGKTWDTYLQLLAHALRHNKVVSFDPNYRAALIGKKIKIFRTRTLEIIKGATIVKFSREEIEVIFSTTDYESAAKLILKLGPVVVLVTLGSHGSFIATPSFTEHVRSIMVKQVDSTGAGDTFIGYFIAQYIFFLKKNNRPAGYNELIIMMRISNIAAALCTTKVGAMNAIPELAEVQDAYDKEAWE